MTRLVGIHRQGFIGCLWSIAGLVAGAIALLHPLPAHSQPLSPSASDLVIGQSPSPSSPLAPLSPSPLAPLSPSSLASPSPSPTPSSLPLDLEPELINTSPVLQRWLQQVPNVMADIKHDRSFRTRLRLGYSQFPSTDDASGWQVGIEDMFIDRTGLTLSADYQASFNGKRESWGADLRYYVLPLGGYVNLAPVVGYRSLETSQYATDGVNVGVRLLFVPSRTGAADISLTQSWVSPGSEDEVGLTTLSVGYALTRNLRLSTDFQKQKSRYRKDSRLGIAAEWMF